MKVYERATELLEAEVGDELVALEPEAGLCFGFNGVATNVWRQLSAPQSFDQIRSRLLAEYEVEEGQCTAELTELLDQMVEKGLVRCTTA
jgi:hypothetical protein